jgi:putative glutamine amidotransferase
MKPRILISGVNSIRESYEKAIIYAGGEPVFAYLPEVDDSYDGLLLSGGGDIDPARFGQENMGSRFINPDRDRVEFALAEAYLRA